MPNFPTKIKINIRCTCDHLHTWHDGFLAVVALGGILIGIALSAEELLILSGEGLVHQRALALEAHEAVLMPVAVLVGQILQAQQSDTQNPVGVWLFPNFSLAFAL